MPFAVAREAIGFLFRQTPLNSKVEIDFLGGEHLLESPLLQEIIGEFIDKHKIQNAQISDDLGIRGAMKIPHLHFNDKIYTLSSEQWAKLSDGAYCQQQS